MPEMTLANYPLKRGDAPSWSAEIAAYVARTDADPGSWRSDSGDLAAERACETQRYDLLRRARPDPDTDLVRRSFLFEQAYHDLRAALHAEAATQRRAMS